MQQETSLIGQFLIAMPGMDDERFKKSVVLITSFSDDGAKGSYYQQTNRNIKL